ncbi:hypothetical protein [Mesoplasma melaleucae]|uniref:Type I restriction modification DNA specificity domain-containing protein n=1 Tax=Mesoplasma melaleucae TaxID=81459 RepID=A0A2K8NXT0_9MOLU|nr:hypothetical protein [Mesoplasma melaleucae]ATZ17978.1 hypothetical protein EMELA_v1c04260 [Mesoplasma melaleucae]
MPKMNPNVACGLKIEIPSIEEEQKIINIIEPLENYISLIENIIKKTFTLMNAIYKVSNKKTYLLKEIAEVKIGGTLQQVIMNFE